MLDHIVRYITPFIHHKKYLYAFFKILTKLQKIYSHINKNVPDYDILMVIKIQSNHIYNIQNYLL